MVGNRDGRWPTAAGTSAGSGQVRERSGRWKQERRSGDGVEAAVSRQRTRSFVTDGVRIEGVGPGWRYLRVGGQSCAGAVVGASSTAEALVGDG